MAKSPTSEPPSDLGDRPPMVIYVMGAGRSGSTVLGVALGNCGDVFYAGELEAWLRKSGVPNFGGSERAQFWEGVRQEVSGDDLFGDKAWRYLEYSLALFRVSRWLGRRRLRPRYRQIAKKLYHVIASSANTTHIVDTSHYPLRAHEMQQLNGIDLYLIYLSRDPLRVTASFERQDVTNPSKSLLAANAYLWLTHLLSVFVFLRHRADKRLLLHYEDLIADPEAVLHDLLDRVGIGARLPDLASLATGIPFQGNRLLESETIALRAGPASSFPYSCGASVTKVLQYPWKVVLARLGPKAPASTSDDRISRSRSY
jgi:hypothetical protein